MTTIINGSSPSITFSDNTTQSTAAPYGPAFSAYQSSAQTVTGSVATKLQFQTEEFDTNSAFDNATNYRFTPQVAGYYQFSGGVNFSTSSGNAQLILYKNGSAYKYLANTAVSTLNGIWGSGLVNLNGSTDYIELYVSTSIGQSLTAISSLTYFQASMVRGS